ncbi:MAG: hypothetical protein ACFFGZ_09985 [Candidatus Thorarchaeota archaeon]
MNFEDVNHPALKAGACCVTSESNWLISLREVVQTTVSTLLVAFQNTPVDASLVYSSVSGRLTRAETFSAPTKHAPVTLAKRPHSASAEDSTCESLSGGVSPPHKSNSSPP